MAVYAGFALFLYPAADFLHPAGFAAALAPSLPIGLHGLLKVLTTHHVPMLAGIGMPNLRFVSRH